MSVGRGAILLLGDETAFELERLIQRYGVSRGQATEDWLIATLCALGAETKEYKYFLIRYDKKVSFLRDTSKRIR